MGRRIIGAAGETGFGKRALQALLTTTALSTAALISPVVADSQTWDGNTDTNYLTATNWVTNNPAPGSGETATFIGTAAPNEPTLSTAHIVGNVNQSGNTFTVNAALTVQTTYNLSGGTLAGSGSVAAQNFSQTNGTITLATVTADRRVTAIGGVVLGNSAAGISATNATANGVQITTSAAGDVNNAAGAGVSANTVVGTGGITMDLAGTAQGTTDGINAVADTGTVNITVRDDVTGGAGSGISVVGAGPITVTNLGGSGVTIEGTTVGNGVTIVSTGTGIAQAVLVSGSSGTMVGAVDGFNTTSTGAPVTLQNWDFVHGLGGDGVDINTGLGAGAGGAISVLNVLAIDGDAGNGIFVRANGAGAGAGGNITVQGSGTGFAGAPGIGINGSLDGINARSIGAGVNNGGIIQIGGTVAGQANGAITGEGGDGLDLGTSGGAINVINNGQITGTAGMGIRANSDNGSTVAGNITIQGNAGITGTTLSMDGINADATGSTTGGIIQIGGTGAGEGNGAILGTTATGIDARTTANAINIIGNGAITGGNGDGIRANSNNGGAANGGNISIQGNGAISGQSSNVFDGIVAQASGAAGTGGDIHIGDTTVNGAISGTRNGINATTNNAGTITITTGATTTTGTAGDGITTLTASGATIVTLGGAVQGGLRGVILQSTSGPITVNGGQTATGTSGGVVAQTNGIININASGVATGAGFGIQAISNLASTTVTTGAGTTSGLVGVVATGQTAVQVNTVGAVSGSAGAGVSANAAAGATAGVTTGAGAVTGSTDGIDVTIAGGAATVIVGGAVTGTAGDGIELNPGAGGTSSVTINAAGVVGGGTNGILNDIGALAGTNNGTINGPIALNIAGGTSSFTNGGTGIGNGNLASAAGVTNTLLTNNGQWNLTPGGTSNLLGANDQIDNNASFRYSGATTTINGLEGFDNSGSGLLTVVPGASGTAQNLVIASATPFNNAGGTINMQNTGTTGSGFVGDMVTLTGNYSAGANGTVNVDINLGPGPDTADVLQVTAAGAGAFTGQTTVNFNNVGVGQILHGPILVIDLNGPTTGTAVAGNLPPPVGLVQYSLQKVGDDWFVLSAPNLAAVGGVAGNIAVVQSTLGAIVNRPSSPFVSGLAADVPAGYCGPGVWTREIGGAVNASSTSTAPGSMTATANVGLQYAGAQFGIDLACFQLGEQQIDVSVGAIAGANMGASTQAVPGAGNTISTFKQGYGGLYATVAKGQFSADIQARVDYTAFTFNNVNIQLANAPLNTIRTTVSGSASYAIPVGEAQDTVIVPTAGFSASRTTSSLLTFTTMQTLQPMPSLSLVGFAGATVAKTFVQPDQVSAVQPFLTGTVYNDFAAFPTALFTDPSTGQTRLVTSSHLGTFGEISVGTNFFKIYDASAGGPKQFNATLRIDARVSNILLGAGATAQFRAQF